ncbi:MAG: hypothetical protein CMK09_06530 [Ponticaulis sp.]|nr:hypothetical protein [Ponticaulis sp.]|tara:strand:+ start:8181 stop:9353 length:1173 start_codon:yes stop_codon:yes gene_type:complete
MKVDIWSPMPPTPSGIAHYVDMLFGCGLDPFDVSFHTDADAKPRDGALQVYQLGNNPHHEFLYEAANERPGIIEIHDFSLHHLVTEMTLARNDSPSYVKMLEASAGTTGRLYAMRRLNGHFHSRLEFDLPLLEDLVRRSPHIIVHSKWARERVRMMCHDANVSLIPHFSMQPGDVGLDPDQRDSLRKKYKIKPDEIVIVCAGFVTEPKRIPWILRALEACQKAGQRNFRLIISGEVQNPQFLDPLRQLPDASKVTVTGFAGEHQFNELCLLADVMPVLRWPSVGESSGVAMRALGFGAEVVALAYKSFTDLPAPYVDFVSLTSEEQIIEDLTNIFMSKLASPPRDQDARAEQIEQIASTYSLAASRTAYKDLFLSLSPQTEKDEHVFEAH